MNEKSLYIAGSAVFAVATVLAVVASVLFDGLAYFIKDVGKPLYYKDSTGSNSEQDVYLFFVVLLLPSAVIRIVRMQYRPALIEIALFVLAAFFVCVGYSAVGTRDIRVTLETTGDKWLAVWLVATGLSLITFAALSLGWMRRR